MNDNFDIGRTLSLLRLDLVRSYRVAIIAGAAIAGVMILQAFLQPFAQDRTMTYVGVIGLVWFIGGAIVASRAFTELHDKTRNDAYLLLPASAFEKVLVRVVLVTVLFPIAAALLVTVGAWLISVIKLVILGRGEAFFSPLEPFDAGVFGLFVLQQSVYTLGAAWFRKHHFVRTALATTVFLIAVVWLFAILARLILPDIGLAMVALDFNPVPVFGELSARLARFGWLAKFVLFVAVPVFCWTVAWMRVRETQVSYGV